MPGGRISGGHILSKRKGRQQGAGLASALDEAASAAPVASTSKCVADRLSPSSLSRRTLDDAYDSDDIDADDFAVPRLPDQEPDESGAPPKKRTKAAAAKGKQPAKPKAKGKGKGKKSEFTPTVPWPEHFKTLEKAFKALNTVYTFCSTRRHLASTFENLRGSVGGLLGRPLEIHDVAQFKSLMPKVRWRRNVRLSAPLVSSAP